MTPAERYLLLGLRLDRHVEGIVDSYYGPAELKTEAESGDPVAPSQLAADGAALLAELEDGWLRDLVLGLETYARVLAGEPISYSDEVERCYGVRPARIGTRSSTASCRERAASRNGGRRGASRTASTRRG